MDGDGRRCPRRASNYIYQRCPAKPHRFQSTDTKTGNSVSTPPPLMVPKTPTISKNTPATSETFELFPPDRTAAYRALAPALDAADTPITHVNSGYHSVMNLNVKEALDSFLAQAATHPSPKAIWQSQASAAQAALASHLNVEPSTLAFTRDTTEGLNLFQRSLALKPGDNVVVLEGEHPNHVYGWLALREEAGLEVRRVRVPDDHSSSSPRGGGPDFADADTFAPYVDDRTACVGVSSVMFHSGQLNDVTGIAARFRPRGVHVLVDMTQHVGAAFGMHKALGCSTGLGALYVNPDPVVVRGLKRDPPAVGAGAVANLPADLVAREHVEYHGTAQRYAHLNVSLVSAVALGASLALLDGEVGMAALEGHFRALGRELITRLDAVGVEVVGSRLAWQRSPHIYIVKLLHPDWAAHFLGEQVYVTHYRRGVRVSFGFYNSVADVESFVRSVARGLEKGIPRA